MKGLLNLFGLTPFLYSRYVCPKVITKLFHFIDSLDEWEKSNYLSKSGKNLGYSAEVMARYVNKHTDYVESHTALDDSKVEFELTRIFCNRYF